MSTTQETATPFQQGTDAFQAGHNRIMPLSDFLNEDGTMDKAGARQWYAGWDSANLAQVIT